MRRLTFRRIFCAIVCAYLATAAFAQDTIIPEYRFVATRNVDFYGEDLDPLFDTTLDACVRACRAQTDCAGFTFNLRANACFPKRALTDGSPFDGALSAEKRPTDPGVLANAADRRANLSMLSDADIQAAANQAESLGFRHPTGGFDVDLMLEAALDAADRGDTRAASDWFGGAAAARDSADLWTEYARLLLAIDENDTRIKQDLATRALRAAANAYLRTGAPAEQASALRTMAEALERLGRGRDMIPALRLAYGAEPRPDIASALDDAIGTYGFRVTDTEVESDSAAPRICVVFSERLVQAGPDYDAYVGRPDATLAVAVDGDRLCIDGVTHGERYRIVLRSGLPAESGEVLFKDVEITQYVRDRSPSVRFPGRTYVLAKSGPAALPVDTVNIDRLDLSLSRISDRNLVRSLQDGLFGRPLAQWQQENFETTLAEEIWSGSAEVADDLNRDVTTRLPMTEALADQPPGIFALSARIPGADPYDNPAAMQWFIVSDLGLLSQSGESGLTVQVNSLATTAPISGVSISLISRANAVLADAVTDDTGAATFDPGLARGTGAAAPAMIVARAGDDLAFLSLTDPAFDLSDRGVEGRAPGGPLDVFLTTDRGAYRAGETIHITALVRDQKVQAVDGFPLTVRLKRPDGIVYTQTVTDGGIAGGHVLHMPLGLDVPRGTWRVETFADPEAAALASTRILVEDFLPERLDVALSIPDAPFRPGDAPPLTVEAAYLFGAPGADLPVAGETRLSASRRLADWPGFQFGPHDLAEPPSVDTLPSVRTGPDGSATLAALIPAGGQEPVPYSAEIIVRVLDGAARPVERRLTTPVQPKSDVIGIRPLFEDSLPQNTTAAFEIVGLAADTLQPRDMAIRWTLNRIETRYQWYQLYGNWNWEPVTRRTRVATGETMLGTAPLSLEQPVEWGQYELVVERLDGPYARASILFDAGWYGAADAAATPDRLDVSLNQASYTPGDTAEFRIDSRRAGTALVSILSDRVIAREIVEIPAGTSIVPIPVTEAWGPGAYVTATLLTPPTEGDRPGPRRSLGLAYASVNPGPRLLPVEIDAPEITRPRGTTVARVRVDGVTDADAWITLAAVDLGILNLTGFESPDPQAHYFGQRRLGVEIRDLYGRLIDSATGAMGTVRSGGDASAGLRRQSPPPTEDLVTLFSGPVQVTNGVAEIPLEIPAFNGTLRLMAVAWSDTGVGQAEADMIVRDPVVVTASLPRFLSPGDQSRLRLTFTHTDGPAGDMPLSVTATPGLTVSGIPEAITLDETSSISLDIALAADRTGDHTLSVGLTLPDGEVLTRDLSLGVRANDPEIAQTRRFLLGAGDAFDFSDDVFAGFRPGSGRAILSAGPLARFDAPAILDQLSRYPYGCTEQVASQAMPLLYLSAVTDALGLGQGPQIDTKIEASVTSILSRQAANGGFGLWRAESGDFWLDAYASDFLSRARAAGHAVPATAFDLALDNLQNRINYAPDFDQGGEDIAYALYVLAREKRASMSDLRYYADEKGRAFATPMAAAQLGAALALYGDQIRADRMFAIAAGQLDRTLDAIEAPVWRADYGTAIRDLGAVLTLAAEAGSAAIDMSTYGARLARATQEGQFSTQESAWTLLAAHALASDPTASGLLVNGQSQPGPFVDLRRAGAAPMTITADAGEPVDITLTTIGVPETAPPAGGAGYAIRRDLYDLDGNLIDGSEMTVGQRFVTVLTISPFEEGGARLMIDDPLPAGVEIDNPSLLRSGDIRALDWLALSEAEHTEFRTDRFLAAVDRFGTDPITLAYVARAVSPGVFHAPAASVEDMYRPRDRARGRTGQMRITE